MRRRFVAGRFFARDRRDARFRIRAAASMRRSRMWAEGTWNGDQGLTPQCVGYAWAHWLHASPIRNYLHPSGIYQFAQTCDEWEGVEYDGTSVRAGAKVLHRLGLIESYGWGRTVDDLVYMLLERGPAVVGSEWFEGMMQPDELDIIRATGDSVGGHAYLVSGVNTKTQFFRVKNSWGTLWGDGGRAYISFADMERLIALEGEICLATEVRAKAP